MHVPTDVETLETEAIKTFSIRSSFIGSINLSMNSGSKSVVTVSLPEPSVSHSPFVKI